MHLQQKSSSRSAMATKPRVSTGSGITAAGSAAVGRVVNQAPTPKPEVETDILAEAF